MGKRRDSNVFDCAVVPINIACGVHQLQHSVLELGEIDGLFMVPRFYKYVGWLLRSLDMLHGFDKLGIEFRRRVT